MSEKAPRPPGLCLESGEFVPAEAIKARAKAGQEDVIVWRASR